MLWRSDTDNQGQERKGPQSGEAGEGAVFPAPLLAQIAVGEEVREPEVFVKFEK